MDSYSTINKNNRKILHWTLDNERLESIVQQQQDEGITALQSNVVDEMLSPIFADEVIFMITSYIETNWNPRNSYLIYKLNWRLDEPKWRKKYDELMFRWLWPPTDLR